MVSPPSITSSSQPRQHQQQQQQQQQKQKQHYEKPFFRTFGSKRDSNETTTTSTLKERARAGKLKSTGSTAAGKPPVQVLSPEPLSSRGFKSKIIKKSSRSIDAASSSSASATATAVAAAEAAQEPGTILTGSSSSDDDDDFQTVRGEISSQEKVPFKLLLS